MRFAESWPDPNGLAVFGDRLLHGAAVFVKGPEQIMGLGEVWLKLNGCFNLRPGLPKLGSSENTLVITCYQ